MENKCDYCDTRSVIKIRILNCGFVSKIERYCLLCSISKQNYGEYVMVPEFIPKVLLCNEKDLPIIQSMMKEMTPLQKAFAPILNECYLMEKHIIYNPRELVMIKKTKSGEVVWLEYGTNGKSGLNYISTRYKEDFKTIGITSQEEIVNVIKKCLSCDVSSRISKSISVYDIGLSKSIRISVSEHGSIITAYPESEIRPKKKHVRRF
jgi:hypothetical protein